jgi:5-methylcytosine-specific restriction enzyme A
MRSEALFINGVFDNVLEEILKIQAVLPEQILFLQPHSSRPIARIQASPPSVDDPMRLFISTSTDLGKVHYVAEIVGWDDKRKLKSSKRLVVETVLNTFQPGEGGLYDLSPVAGVSLNLLHIRRLEKLKKPFGVDRLTKVVGGELLSPNRSMSGGWSYVRPEWH